MWANRVSARVSCFPRWLSLERSTTAAVTGWARGSRACGFHCCPRRRGRRETGWFVSARWRVVSACNVSPVVVSIVTTARAGLREGPVGGQRWRTCRARSHNRRGQRHHALVATLVAGPRRRG